MKDEAVRAFRRLVAAEARVAAVSRELHVMVGRLSEAEFRAYARETTDLDAGDWAGRPGRR